ncbi:hypothetical protein [Propionibacterium cyclohexanicum]|nr:hypothetical protein [Propionibacterium cyclohexanicum]
MSATLRTPTGLLTDPPAGTDTTDDASAPTGPFAVGTTEVT